MRFFSAIFLILVFVSLFYLPVEAIENPLSVSNNRFGIHVIDENDLDRAADLVNSSGGDWGYVTLVIREDDRDPVKWQRLFDRLRQLHLIPLLRLATQGQGSSWRAPRPEDALSWAQFLNSLNWVVKNRYVILFNEPNHAKEWGGGVKPAEFATVIKSFSDALKSQSPDFFILPGAVDSASPDSRETISARQFYKWMHAAEPNIFTYYDGLVSHSYPHPDFVGKVTDRGPGTITAYRWEQDYLKSLGLPSNLPIFITETGWSHNGGLKPVRPALTPERISQNYTQAFNQIWTDPQITAITPFILNYQDSPFEQFSWVKPGGTETYPHYEAVKSLTKAKGEPVQITQVLINPEQIPPELVVDSRYQLKLEVKNNGQNIWSPETDSIIIISDLVENSRLELPLSETKPGESTNVNYNLTTPNQEGILPVNIIYSHNGEDKTPSENININVINPPSLYVKAQLWYKRRSSGQDFSLLIYDNGHLLKKIYPFNLNAGTGYIEKLSDIIPNRTYRFVIVKPYYLPRQVYAFLNDTVTTVTFNRLLPIDFHPDGQLNYQDILSGLSHPINTLSLLWW